MKNVYILQIVTEVHPLIRPKNAEREGKYRPEMNDAVIPAIMMGEFMDLSMAVMTPGNAIGRAAGLDLFVLEPAIFQALLLETRLEKTAAAATAVVIRLIRRHLHQVFFSDCLLNGVSEIVGNGIAEAFSNNLARILNGKLDFQILIPVGIRLQFPFSDPFSVIFVNILCFKVVSYIEFFQSGPDCEGNVASLRVEVGFHPQGIGLPRFLAHQVFPIFCVG